MTIPTRHIADLTVGALGLGCMGMSSAYGRRDDAESVRTVHRALDLGVTLLDTADFYGNGSNEELLGRALRGRRDEAVVATKFGIVAWPVVGLPRRVDGRPERVRRCVEASLRRLGTDRIDLFYLHRIDPKVPVEETVGAMAELVSEGKLRHLGLSEAGPDALRRAAATHPIAALQTEWSLFSRDIEHGPLPVARELGIAVVPYSPLGRGMLTGDAAATRQLSLLDFRRLLPRWRRANLEHNLALVEQIRTIADGLGATPGQVALAWLLAQGDDVVPIPGTKRRRWLEQNVGAIDVTLPADAVATLEALRPHGARYAASPTGVRS